jgi:hypothetical protein
MNSRQDTFLDLGLSYLRKENSLAEENIMASLQYNRQKYILYTIMNGGMILYDRYGAKRVVTMAYDEFHHQDFVVLLNKIENDPSNTVFDDAKVMDELMHLLDNFSDIHFQKVENLWTKYQSLAKSLSHNDDGFDQLLSKTFYQSVKD